MTEAAVMVDRSLSSLRAWCRDGRLTKHREDLAAGGSRVLVSRAELLALAGSALVVSPGRPPPAAARGPGSAPSPRPELDAVRADLEAVRLLLAAERAHLVELREGHAVALGLARELAEAQRHRAEDTARELEAVRAELGAARAELEAMRAAGGLPWWRRLLGSAPRLPDGDT